MNLKDLYRQVILDHYKNPRNKGLISNDLYKIIHLNNPSCGDEIVIQLLIENDKIIDIRHEGVGCSICCASASVASLCLKEKTISEGINTINEFYEMVKGLPFNSDLLLEDALVFETVHMFPARIKCATLAWKAIEKGLKEH